MLSPLEGSPVPLPLSTLGHGRYLGLVLFLPPSVSLFPLVEASGNSPPLLTPILRVLVASTWAEWASEERVHKRWAEGPSLGRGEN